MSSRYTAGGRRKSSMTHARRGHPCQFCDTITFGNGWALHGRKHVRESIAVELVKHYEFVGMSPSRLFLPVGDERIAGFLADGFERVA